MDLGSPRCPLVMSVLIAAMLTVTITALLLGGLH
jgi:hypothetical protein